MTEFTLEQFESIGPTYTVRFVDKEIHYHTPDPMTKWRVDTLIAKEPDINPLVTYNGLSRATNQTGSSRERLSPRTPKSTEYP